MKTRKLHNDQRGIAHLGLVLIVVIFVAAGSLVAWRFKSADKAADSTNSQVTQADSEEELNKQLESSLADVEQNSDISDEQEEVIGNE